MSGLEVPLPRGASVGEVTYPPGVGFGPRRQVNVELLVVLTGEMTLEVEQQAPVRVPAGSVCALVPGRRERFVAGSQPCRQAWAHGFWAQEPDALTAQLRELPGPHPMSASLGVLLREALAVQSGHLPSRGEVLAALVLAMLWRYVGDARDGRSRLPEPVDQARWFVDAHLADPLTLTAVARAAGVTPEHLVRLFRAHLGTTPMSYLWRRRVESAVELLVSTGLPLDAVARRCGFATGQHFSRRVRAQTGLSPGQVRQRARHPG